MTAEQLRPDDLPMSDDAKRAMALELISDEIAYSPPFGGALHVWRWVKEQIVAASTAPTATSPRVETSGEPETATASPAQFEQAVDELEQSRLDVYRVGFLAATNPATQRGDFEKAIATHAAARAALLSLFAKQQERVKQEQYTNQRMCDTQLMMQEQHAAELSALSALTPRPAAGAPTRAAGETARETASFMTKEWCIAAAEREAHFELLTRAKTALENWGRHFSWCDIWKDVNAGTTTHTCNCGLVRELDALAALNHPSAGRPPQ